MVLALAWLCEPVAAAASPEEGIGVEIDGVPVLLDPAPLLINGRTFVPLRGVFELLGAEVGWHAESRQVSVHRDPTELILELESTTALLNGAQLPMDAAPFLYQNRTFIPLRFVTEALGERVDWDPERQVVGIWSAINVTDSDPESDTKAVAPSGPDEPVEPVEPANPTPVISYTPEEFELLARVINAEAYNQPFDGQVAVGAVIINRVLNEQFPDTIYDVIHQPGQFGVIANGQVNRTVSERAYAAAMEALLGVDPTGGAFYFFNPNKTTSSFLLGRPVSVEIGNHAFAH